MRLGATRWLIGLGVAVVFIALVAAAASIGTMLRVRRALAEAGEGGGGPVGHNARLASGPPTSSPTGTPG